ncbi:MAG: hypothetical protein B6240_13065 [Desulfobacteraceae bacterium 4572_87]|nr:MAG: hypothetical protein B6240_13065 [Desulfobacteraceae bacterium 4572_87]
MKIDAHYYAVLAFARAIGFNRESAQTIAYASQFVDDARINHVVIEGHIPDNVQYETIEGKASFFNTATCHSYTRIKTFNYSAMINNTAAFHFVPGCNGNHFVKQLRCTEEGPVIMDIFQEALLEDDLVKLGIVLHAYADTFSHQGFSGLLSKVNDIEQVQVLKGSGIVVDKFKFILKWIQDAVSERFDLLIPAYGHGQAMVYPDIPYLIWQYAYDYTDAFSMALKLSGTIDNRDRFKRAFQCISKHLTCYLQTHEQYRGKDSHLDSLHALFDALLIKKMDGGRIRNWQKVLVEQGLLDSYDHDALEYDEHRWLKDAFSNFDREKFDRRKVAGASLRSDFAQSHWYRYYRAVKWYKDRLFHHCKNRGLEICC